MTDTCVCCPIYRPNATAHTPTTGPVCGPCRSRMHRDAFAVPRLHHDLSVGDRFDVDRRLTDVLDDRGHPTGQYRWADPIAALLPAGAVAARSGQPVVTGTRAYSTPIDIDTIDLTAPARHGAVPDEHGDQIGHLSAATLLDGWAHAFRVALFPTHSRPEPTVYALVRWLTHGAPTSRLDTACTHYPAIAGFAAELRHLCAALRGAAGETEPARQVLWAVPCPGCNKVSQLVREADYIECDACGRLLTDTDYRTWAAETARKLRPAANADTAGSKADASAVERDADEAIAEDDAGTAEGADTEPTP